MPQVHVLLFHRVCEVSDDPLRLAIKPATFRDLLSQLRAQYELLSIPEILQRRGSRSHRPMVAISFDDGYEDNYAIAAEILDTMQIPATFFITTSYIDSDREIWPSDLNRIFLSKSPVQKTFTIRLDGQDRAFATREDAYAFVRQKFLASTADAKVRALDEICKSLSVGVSGRESYRFLSSDQIRKLAANKLFTIGAHTHSHPSLSLLNPQDQLQEIVSSKEKLETLIKMPVDYFAYPFGQRRDFTQDTVSICKKAGFKACFTAYPGPLDFFTNRYALPRFNAGTGLLPSSL